MKKTQPVCAACGSDAVCVDATATWSIETQDWELAGTMDSAWCEECEGECDFDWEEVQ